MGLDEDSINVAKSGCWILDAGCWQAEWWASAGLAPAAVSGLLSEALVGSWVCFAASFRSGEWLLGVGGWQADWWTSAGLAPASVSALLSEALVVSWVRFAISGSGL